MHKTAQSTYFSDIKETQGKKEKGLGWWEKETLCGCWLGGQQRARSWGRAVQVQGGRFQTGRWTAGRLAWRLRRGWWMTSYRGAVKSRKEAAGQHRAVIGWRGGKAVNSKAGLQRGPSSRLHLCWLSRAQTRRGLSFWRMCALLGKYLLL